MSHTFVTPQPVDVPRPKHVRVRSLLAVACIAILGLTIALVLLATSQTVSSAGVTSSSMITPAAASEAGARLDHSGRKEAWLLSVMAEPGSRLDHRGVRASSQR
jgi:hypothetical protein